MKKHFNIKKAISLVLGFASAFLLACEIEDLSLCWIKVAAMVVLLAVLAWNGCFRKEAYEN